MATFIINDKNPITFKKRDSLLPNFDNTLSYEENFSGVVSSCYAQKFLQSKTITIQINTDYDTIEATLFDSIGATTSLPVTLIKQSADPNNSDVVYSFYEFSISAQPEGRYHIEVKGTLAGEENQYRKSEYFDIVKGVVGFRNTVDGTNLPYEYIPDHFNIVASNIESRYIYWGDQRISGDPFEVSIWVPGTIRKPQPGGEITVYNNGGNLTKLEQESQRFFELKTEDIPQFLALKIDELSALDFFAGNDIQFVTEENGETENFGNYINGVFTMTLPQRFVEGINSDDEGINIIDDEDMAGVLVPTAESVSSTQTLVVTGGYAINLITWQLLAGTTGTIKIGSSPGGNEILRVTSIVNSKPNVASGRNFINESNPDLSFNAYITITGVGALVKVRLQTILNTQS